MLTGRGARPSGAHRLICDGVHLDLGVDDGARLHGGAGQHHVLEVLGEHLVVAAEVARILEDRWSPEPHR